LNNNLAHNTGADTTDQNGRQVHTRRWRDFGAFKTPTLRRTSDGPTATGSTALYFHDGFASTQDVIDFYDVGGGSAEHRCSAGPRSAPRMSS
jgi:cytochrome c peroxidase